MSNQWPEYHIIQEILDALKSDMTPAELQGIALGLFCWDDINKAQTQWQIMLEKELKLFEQDAETHANYVDKLYTASWQNLNNEGLVLQLFLPDDESEMEERTHALVTWCRGFLYGLGLMGNTQKILSNPLIKESIQDIAQLTNLDEFSDSTEENEKAFAEIVEYLRIVVHLIYSEMLSNITDSGKSVHGFH